MAQKLSTFSDIVTAIREAIGVQATDTNAVNKIKRFVNLYYLNEIVPFKQWTWLQKSTSVVHKAYYNTGTVSVTPQSAAVTLNTAPNVTVGSLKGYRFSVENSNKVYTITAHTAADTAITLNVAYQEAVNATANFKVWRDSVDLPIDAKETTEITHAEQIRPLEAIGPQEFRKREARNPKEEGFPVAYNTHDFFDPSPSDDETESDRYRQVRIYPSVVTSPVTLNIDYIQEVTELDDDSDEPLIPISDRIALYYGAGAMAWSIINRNEEMFASWHALAGAKLARMAGDKDDGYDQPTLAPKSGYLSAIRRSGLRNKSIATVSHGGQSSVSLPSYLVDVIINGGNLTNDLTADTGVLIDGRDVGADGILLDSLAGSTPVTITDDTTEAIAVWDVDDYNVVHINYSIARSTNFEAGSLVLITNGSLASYSQGPITTIGTACGITFDVDVSSGNLRLLSTSTATGDDAQLTYQAFKWKATAP